MKNYWKALESMEKAMKSIETPNKTQNRITKHNALKTILNILNFENQPGHASEGPLYILGLYSPLEKTGKAVKSTGEE